MDQIHAGSNWYVLYTSTGQEDKLLMWLETYGEKLEKCLYEACFSMTYENIWRYQQRSYLEVKRMFPGYLFLITDHPEEMYEQLREIPQFVRLLAEPEENKSFFYNIPKEEVDFLYSLIESNSDGDYCVHRSFCVRTGHKITKTFGALEKHLPDIIKADYKQRRVIIEKTLLGQRRTIKLCIYDENDCKVEGIPLPFEEEKTESPFMYKVGDQVMLTIDGYENRIFTIKRVNEQKRKVYVALELFGRELEMEVGENDII